MAPRYGDFSSADRFDRFFNVFSVGCLIEFKRALLALAATLTQDRRKGGRIFIPVFLFFFLIHFLEQFHTYFCKRTTSSMIYILLLDVIRRIKCEFAQIFVMYPTL